jgi:hypothetical protein
MDDELDAHGAIGEKLHTLLCDRRAEHVLDEGFSARNILFAGNRRSGNDQDGWFVDESERAARGELVGLERVALMDGGVAEVFRLHPPGVRCPPHSIPPVFPPAPVCAEADGRCKVR